MKINNGAVSVLVSVVMVLASEAQAWCGEGFVVKSQLPPQNRITLHDDGVIRTLCSVQLPAGDWDVTGAVTVQFSCFGPQGGFLPLDPKNDLNGFLLVTPGYFLYSYADISTSPNSIANDAVRSIDARPRGTWWFGMQPVKRVFCGPTTIYLNVSTYGQIPAGLTQAFGGIIANRFH